MLPQPPGLIAPGLIQRRVGQAPQDAGLVEQSLAVPGQVDHGAAPRFSGTGTPPTSHHLVPPFGVRR